MSIVSLESADEKNVSASIVNFFIAYGVISLLSMCGGTKLKGIGGRYDKCNSFCDITKQYRAYGGVKFSLKPDVSSGRFLWLNKIEISDIPCNHDIIVKTLMGRFYYCTDIVSM